ncbi:MAG TPA: cell division protein FtsA [Candidatus Eisenbacteria bacterium]|nr:cell division protein FtsA [Candidatus Eisenbacteria bacterium]
MAKKDKYLVGLDIGSTKTCVLLTEYENERVRFLALGAAESKGLRKGLIVNLDSTVSSIRRAAEEAESVANVPVESAVIGVAGSHVRGVNSRGGIALGNRARDVEREDMRRAVDTARNIAMPDDREVVHVLPYEFLVDAQDGIRDPIGMIGQRLEANIHLVTASMAATQNLVTAANKAGILINDTVLEPLASAEACLTQDEKDLGCCLLDIGGGSTDLVVLGGGAVRHSGTVAIGGDHFTNDLAVGLRTPIPEAERIKHRHGCAASEFLHDDGAIEIASVGDRPPRTIFARNLTEIIEPRAQELLVLVGEELRRAGLERQIPAGFVLAGGGSQLNGFADLAEQAFQLPVRLAQPRGILDLPDTVAIPEYATVVGLVLHAAKTRRTAAQRGNGFVSRLKAMIAGA